MHCSHRRRQRFPLPSTRLNKGSARHLTFQNGESHTRFLLSDVIAIVRNEAARLSIPEGRPVALIIQERLAAPRPVQLSGLNHRTRT